MYADLCVGRFARAHLSVAIAYTEVGTAVGSVSTLVVLNIARAADSGGNVEEVRVIFHLEAPSTSSYGWSGDASEALSGESLKITTSGSCTCVSCTRSGIVICVTSSRCSFSFVSTNRDSYIRGAVTIRVRSFGDNTINSLQVK